MKIVCDDKIPYIRPALQKLADNLVLKPGKEISADDVRDADILLVRTRTRCDERLLEGSRVGLVVTATIGYDHLDTRWLESRGVEWANCPGCNASSVGQYVRNSLLQMKRQRGLRIGEATMGIVGVGHVGTAVLEAVQSLGLQRILLNDPPRETAGELPPEGYVWSSLRRIVEEADIITFHTPLTLNSECSTFHLADSAFFQQLALSRRRAGKEGVVLINAARGGVVDEEALFRAMDDGAVAHAVIDTWEGEPDLNRQLLRRAFVATPHIAGYSADGKANATRMTLQRVCRYLHRPMDFDIQPPALPDDFRPSVDPEELALQLYDPLQDSSRLKESPSDFERLRGAYPLRREFA